MTDVSISVGLKGLDTVNRGWTQIESGAKKAKGAAEGTASAFTKLTDSMKNMAKGALAGGALAAFAMKLVALEDNMEQTARAAHRLGVSFEGFQKLQLTAKRFGADIGSVTVALRTFNRQIGDASMQPMGVQQKLFDALGVSIRDAAGELRGTEDVFRDTVNAIQRIGSVSERTKVLSALFGEQAAELLTMLGGGTEQLDAFGDHLQNIGAIVGEHVAPSMRDANSVVADFTDFVQGTAMKVMAGAIMAFEDLGTAMADIADWSTIIGDQGPKVDQKGLLAGFRKDMMTKPKLAGVLDTGKEARDRAAAAAKARAAVEAQREAEEKLRNEVELLRAEDEALKAVNEELWGDMRAMVDQARTPVEHYREEIANLNAVFEDKSAPEYVRVLEHLNLKLANTDPNIRAVESALDQLFDNAIQGGDEFLALLEDVGKQLGTELLHANVFDPLKDMAKSGLGSLLGGGGSAEESEGGLGGKTNNPMQMVFEQFLGGLNEILGGGDEGFLGGLTKLFMGEDGIMGMLGDVFSTAWEFMGGLFTSFLTEMGILQAWEIAERWALAIWDIAQQWAIAIFEAVTGFLGFETGGDLTVTRPTLIMVGEKNKAERVRVSPLGGPARANAQANVNRMMEQREGDNQLAPIVNVYLPQSSILTDLTAGQFARKITGAVNRQNARTV